MAFFFSAGAAIQRRVKKGHTTEDSEEECDEKNPSDKQQVLYWPAISYSMAVQSQNGTHVSTLRPARNRNGGHSKSCARLQKGKRRTVMYTFVQNSIFHLLRD